MLFRDDIKAIADKARTKVFESCPGGRRRHRID